VILKCVLSGGNGNGVDPCLAKWIPILGMPGLPRPNRILVAQLEPYLCLGTFTPGYPSVVSPQNNKANRPECFLAGIPLFHQTGEKKNNEF
jgi:hypothetical protein